MRMAFYATSEGSGRRLRVMLAGEKHSPLEKFRLDARGLSLTLHKQRPANKTVCRAAAYVIRESAASSLNTPAAKRNNTGYFARPKRFQ